MLTILLVIALSTLLFTSNAFHVKNRLADRNHATLPPFHLNNNDGSIMSRVYSSSDPSTKISAAVPEKERDVDMFKYFVLFIVPCIWGSYTPLVKGLYTPSTVPIAPPTIIFNLLSYLVSFTTLSVASLFRENKGQGDGTTQDDVNTNRDIDNDNIISVISKRNSLNNDASPKEIPLETTAGIELGLYLFMGSSLQVVGIQGTSALHASILVQLTTVVVPVLDNFLSRRRLSMPLLFSCIMGLLGVIYIATDSDTNDLNIFSILNSFSPSTLNTADLFVCASAIFYSLHIVRLNSVANRVSPIKLGRTKSLTELLSSFIVTLVIIIYSSTVVDNGNNVNEISSYFQTVFRSDLFSSGNLYVAFAILWNGVFATALTVWAQTIGQKYVNATTANLIYSSQPIFAALFSFAFLGDTQFSTSFVIGTAFLFISVLSAISLQDD